MAKAQPARTLHFQSLGDILAEGMRIAARPEAPTRGAWSASENIWHVARYIQASVEGYPFKVPWWMKLIGPLMKKRVTGRAMPAGFYTPAYVSRHMEPQSADASQTVMHNAIALLETWVARAEAEGYIDANPLFGKMSREQWVALHCRHAELHFGMIDLDGAATNQGT